MFLSASKLFSQGEALDWTLRLCGWAHGLKSVVCETGSLCLWMEVSVQLCWIVQVRHMLDSSTSAWICSFEIINYGACYNHVLGSCCVWISKHDLKSLCIEWWLQTVLRIRVVDELLKRSLVLIIVVGLSTVGSVSTKGWHIGQESVLWVLACCVGVGHVTNLIIKRVIATDDHTLSQRLSIERCKIYHRAAITRCIICIRENLALRKLVSLLFWHFLRQCHDFVDVLIRRS